MKKISFIVTGSGTINAVANNKAYTVPRDHPNYKEIKAAVLKDDFAVLDSLVNVQKAIEKQGEGNTEVRDGVVYYKGTPVHNVLAERILGLMRDEFPVAPMLRFLDNLMENPSFRAVNELYAFLEHKCLPLTEDGCFLGYKRVRDNYTDQHSGKYDNSVGKVHEIPRNTVDDNWRLECSNGFHVGSIEYVRNFHGGTGHVMIVKVNPRDVVAVPPNECTKMRVCRYEVMNEYDKNLIDALPSSLYTAEATPANRVPESGGMGGYGYRDDEDEDDFDEDGDLDDDDDDFDDEDDEDDEDDDDEDEDPTKG